MYKKEQLLRDTGVFVLGLEGTLVSGGCLVEGVPEFLEAVRQTKREFLIYTNQNDLSGTMCKKLLEELGCDVPAERILTSAEVALRYLNSREAGKSVYLIGPPAMEELFAEAGVHLTEDAPDLVVVGTDCTFTYEKLKKACGFVSGGAGFLATGAEPFFKRDGQQVPDSGAICAAITAVTGKQPTVLGLPTKEAVEIISDYTGIRTDYMTFVGDRLDVEVAAGTRNGLMGFLVLTGETALEDVFEARRKPDLIFGSVKEMGDIMRSWIM